MTALIFPRIKAARIIAAVIFSLSLLWSLPGFAIKLEGDAAGAYTRYCSGEERAVWVETFDSGSMSGYIRLICLQEAAQEISYWWITPQKLVIGDSQLPETIEPPADRYSRALALILYSPGHPINLDRTAATPLLLSFEVDQPTMLDLNFDYASSGSASTSSNGETTSTANYYVEGQEVDQATYEAYENRARAAEREQNVERNRLIELEAKTMLYDLVDSNNWHDWLDVDSVNSDAANNACWIYKDTLLVGLTRTQIKRVVATSAEYVDIGVYTKPTDDGLDDSVTSSNTQISVESECARINSDENANSLSDDIDENDGASILNDDLESDKTTELNSTDVLTDEPKDMQFDDENAVTQAVASGGSSSGSVNDALLFILAGMLLLRIAARRPKAVPIKQKSRVEND